MWPEVQLSTSERAPVILRRIQHRHPVITTTNKNKNNVNGGDINDNNNNNNNNDAASIIIIIMFSFKATFSFIRWLSPKWQHC